MSYYTYPQVICRKCGTSVNTARDECPICGSDLAAWKNAHPPPPLQKPEVDRAEIVRSRAAKKGICNYCMQSFPIEELATMDDNTKICETCWERLNQKGKLNLDDI